MGFALTPCIIHEVGHTNFELGENEMAMGMGIHGEPGIWNGPLKTSREIAQESLDAKLGDGDLGLTMSKGCAAQCAGVAAQWAVAGCCKIRGLYDYICG